MNNGQTVFKAREQLERFGGIFSPHFSRPQPRFLLRVAGGQGPGGKGLGVRGAGGGSAVPGQLELSLFASG